MLILMMLVKLEAFCKCRASLTQAASVLGSYVVGQGPPTFAKGFMSDYLGTLDWDKTPPASFLPREVIEKISAKYREAFRRLTSNEIVSTEANAER